MYMKKFDKNNTSLCNQFDNILWIEESGISEAEQDCFIKQAENNI